MLCLLLRDAAPLTTAPYTLVGPQARPRGPSPCACAPKTARRGPSRLRAAPLEFPERLERKAEKLKCPFFRRRLLDVAAAARESGDWLAARHKSLLFFRRPPAAAAPARALSPAETRRLIQADFDARQYYVTGQLSREAYAPDCVFDSPDPDMPVRSVEVFASAVRGLFDRRTSRVELLEPPRLAGDSIIAEWRLEGTLRLPWRPALKPFVGRTTFALDEFGRVKRHDEEWSLPVWDAFGSALVPRLRLGRPPAPAVAVLRASRADAEPLRERWPALLEPEEQASAADPPAPATTFGNPFSGKNGFPEVGSCICENSGDVEGS